MAKATSRTELKDYAMRKLGWPVIEINVDDDQVDDRIDEALEFYYDYHYDGVEKLYFAHEVTDTDITNSYITVPDSLIHVTRVLPFGAGGGGLYYPMGDPSLAWNSTSANPLSGAGGAGSGFSMRSTSDHAGGGSGGGGSKSSFYLQMAAIEEFNLLFSGGEPTIRFSRHMNRVVLDIEMAQRMIAGNFLVIEGWGTLDPDMYTDVYNDRWLKRYLAALIKQQWGSNLIKYSGIQLPGGVTLDGDKLYEQATNEIEKLEEEMQLKYELPCDFYMG